jgi:adenylate cyclase
MAAGPAQPARPTCDHVAVATDFEAEGLLEGIGDERARRARLDLLRTLEDEGFSLEELRRAAAEGRLALLPLERVLEGEGPRYTEAEVAADTGLDVEFLREARRATGAPRAEPRERVLTVDDLELAKRSKRLLDAGLGRETVLEVTRAMSQAMSSVAAAMTTAFGEALLRPGDTERDLGLRYAESMRELGPLAGPALQHMLNLRLREQVRNAVVGQAELQTGRLPGAQRITVAFVDIVGFTSLGEQIPPDQLGAVVSRFERRAEDAASPPVRLVKTIGDAAMLTSPDVDPLLRATLDLVEGSKDGENTQLLRGGVAAGEALPRAGDWYGRPVNLASRLTAFARRGTVVAAREVHEAAGPGFEWSFAGSRRFRGVRGEVDVYRVRPSSPVRAS